MHDTRMQLIIVQGQSATGKTTLANRLAKDLGYEIFLKDTYKEARLDELGKRPKLREFFRIEEATWDALYTKVRESIAAGRPLIIEGNFLPKQHREMVKLVDPGTNVVEVFCFARGWTAFRRYVKRNRSGNRHKGHMDHLWYPWIFRDTLLAKIGIEVYKPLGLSPNIMRVDTTDFKAVDYGSILRYIKDRR